MIRYIILYYFKDSAMSCYVHALVILFSYFPISAVNNLCCKFLIFYLFSPFRGRGLWCLSRMSFVANIVFDICGDDDDRGTGWY